MIHRTTRRLGLVLLPFLALAFGGTQDDSKRAGEKADLELEVIALKSIDAREVAPVAKKQLGDVECTLIPDERTNSLLVAGSDEAIARVRELVEALDAKAALAKRIDEPTIEGIDLRVYRLEQGTPAVEWGQLATSPQEAFSTVEQLVKDEQGERLLSLWSPIASQMANGRVKTHRVSPDKQVRVALDLSYQRSKSEEIPWSAMLQLEIEGRAQIMIEQQIELTSEWTILGSECDDLILVLARRRSITR
ncbi:MAG: secretin N-terminal domain-containing protein [Planctomycetota bacterium]